MTAAEVRYSGLFTGRAVDAAEQSLIPPCVERQGFSSAALRSPAGTPVTLTPRSVDRDPVPDLPSEPATGLDQSSRCHPATAT